MHNVFTIPILTRKQIFIHLVDNLSQMPTLLIVLIPFPYKHHLWSIFDNDGYNNNMYLGWLWFPPKPKTTARHCRVTSYPVCSNRGRLVTKSTTTKSVYFAKRREARSITSIRIYTWKTIFNIIIFIIL